MNRTKTIDTRKLVLLALLTAIVVVLQVLAIVTKPLFPIFSISLVLLPIVIGAALTGVYAGGWLGLAFGFAVLLSGDAAGFLSVNPGATILVVLLKGTLAGLAAGCAYKLFAHKSKTAAALAAAIVCPIVNTGVFLIGSCLFFLPAIAEWGVAEGYESTAAYVFIGMIGLNFLVEFGINLILSPVIVRLVQYGQDKKAVAPL